MRATSPESAESSGVETKSMRTACVVSELAESTA